MRRRSALSALIYPELRLRMLGKRPVDDSQVDQSKRSCDNGLSIVPWSAFSGEKRNLEVDEGKQQKKPCTSGRDEQLFSLPPPLLDDQDEILWCGFIDDNVIEEWRDKSEGHHGATTEQLVQGVAKKGKERGANVHEKSLIWAAKDTEWKKLEEKGAVRQLTGQC